jgi:phosphopantothenoylcysteine decarboxylase/phosphopantothenate--cysteine ligase
VHPSDAIRGTLSQRLSGKTVVLGVTGSIAATETVKLARELIRHGADLIPVMSRAAQDILHPNSLQFATGHDPIVTIDGSVPYVDLCGERGSADLLLIAPSTANTLSKIAHGIDDTAVTTFATAAMGSGIPIVIAPAMHGSMWKHPIVAENIQKLRDLGVAFVEPLMEERKAKMAPVDAVVAHAIRAAGPGDLGGKKVTVIAGSTQEAIDDVRAVTSLSTGATGIELARRAFERGADVELWLGGHSVEPPSHVPTREFSDTRSLIEMVPDLDCDICTVPAAISDYAPERKEGKIPSGKESFTLDMHPLPKVIKAIREKSDCLLVSFKAASGMPERELEKEARACLGDGVSDAIVANNVGDVTPDETKILIVTKAGTESFAGPKSEAAERIWSAVVDAMGG